MVSATEVDRRTEPMGGALVGPPVWHYRLGVALAAVVALGAGLTFAMPGVLHGPAAMQGCARGTALVMVLLGVPLLLLGMWGTSRGHAIATFAWLGVSGYLIYNAVMLLFGTPFNRLFLLYVAMLGLSLATVIALVRQLDVTYLARRLSAAPARVVAGYLGLIALGNALVWLRAVVRDLGAASATHLEGTGLTTNPIYVQDLAFWLPLAGLIAVLLWRRKPWGYVLGAALLCMWTVESVGVAVDQWFGSQADPTSPVATMGGSYLFAALAVISLVPTWLMLGRLSPSST